MTYQKQFHKGVDFHHLLHKILSFVRQNVVICVAVLLAIGTSLVVPPDASYASYFDWKTLTCLFSTLAVICALKNIKFFTVLARKIVDCTGNLRMAALALVYIIFIGSMLISNDMALLTFLPLGYFVLSSTGKEKHMAYIFIMQNIAANLGGMLTPFGNPQNLYLYSKFNIPTGEFMQIMLIPFLAAIALITLCCLFLPKEPLSITEACPFRLPKGRTIIYLLLFLFSIVIVF
ncbi:MAG: citrate transporter, partial [Clostridia bacterium]|nr:citrate transporter [Clostridia bacterium]